MAPPRCSRRRRRLFSSEPQQTLRNSLQDRFIRTPRRSPAVSIRDLRTFEGRPLANQDEPIFDQGLAFDLETVMARRQLLKLLGVATTSASLLALAACLPTGNAASSGTASTSGASGSAATADCTTIPEETSGPYPGDGSN